MPAPTRRLQYRIPQPHDVELLASLARNPLVYRYGVSKRSGTYEEAQAFLAWMIDRWERDAMGFCIVTLSGSNHAIGYAGLKFLDDWPFVERTPAATSSGVEVGYVLMPEVWGNGYASEAACAALGDAFGRLGLDRVVARCDPENAPSAAVMRRIGMQFDGSDGSGPGGRALLRYAIEREAFTCRSSLDDLWEGRSIRS